MKNRNISLDIVRTIACIMVIVYHSPQPGVVNSLEASTASIIGVPCIGLFFMVSGYLLLPTKDSLFPFLKKRMNRILLPTLFWTAFYLLVNYIENGNYLGQSWIQTFASIPFTRQGHGVLWFLYTITGIYILSPILSAWLSNATKREVQFLLGLWGITLCFPYLRPFVILTEDVYGWLYYFSGFVGYFLLGYYIKMFKPTLSLITIMAMYFVPFVIAPLSKYAGIEVLYHSYDYLSLMVAMMCLGIFLFVIKVVSPSCVNNAFGIKILTSFSNCSFGVYLVHIFVMHKILWKMDILSSFGGTIQIILCVLFTTIISWIIVLLLSYLPNAEYIIGYKTNRNYARTQHLT